MSAQLEDGYTRIANELLEELPKFKFNGTQLRIIMVVWRFTYGFKRKDHEMSLTFFVKAIGLGKTQIDREVTNLVQSKVLIVTEEPTYTKSRKIGFNKNYDEWEIEYSQLKSIQSAKTLTVSENAEEQSANMSTPTVSKNADQEIYSFKDNLKDSQEEEKVMTPMDAYYHSFKKWNYTGQIQGYIAELMKRGFTDSFVTEVFLAMGEFGANPDVNYMKKLAEDWVGKGIYTLAEAKRRREEEKKKSFAPSQPSYQAPKEYIPDPELLEEMRELERLRKAN